MILIPTLVVYFCIYYKLEYSADLFCFYDRSLLELKVTQAIEYI